MAGATIRSLATRTRDRAAADDTPPRSASRIGATPAQAAVGLVFVTALTLAIIWWPVATSLASELLVAGIFLLCGVWRIALVILSRPGTGSPPTPTRWPRYTVLVPLHDEVEVMAQLVRRLSAIDYPADRLEGWLILEAHDHATLEAAVSTPRPDWLNLMVVPPGKPGTKPRALNFALPRIRGELLTVYDAEDAPHPRQLKEAASHFAADGTGRLACLQAPLRVRIDPSTPSFLGHQFAAEYAALFEVILPAMSRIGLPFPLGGTSNHFRVDVLRSVGGWDAWNVTEDADLGFRLWRHGWRLGVIGSPTREAPPVTLEQWLPQRTRWLKGYMQTWGVHTRDLTGLGARGVVSLIMTLGVALISAAVHAPSLAWIATAVVIAAVTGLPPATPAPTLGVFLLGTSAAWLTCAIGARRAGLPYHVRDMLIAPAYWSLLSLAFAHALWRLIREPFIWDKTRHKADPVEAIDTVPAADSGRMAA
ncbi:glycosyltransferase family 2 protein [uncultured Brevundimonas sp.]|uniref:glycosyltransferase family 2 protein n=1 Tax=uncultured Brevundimonas sp. TaxID=213418 RepID=UPI0030EF0050|tara:strand:+ start:15434 stop:16870 length:1437 start_codon:yes stop_codon:yes gene_type:complete